MSLTNALLQTEVEPATAATKPQKEQVDWLEEVKTKNDYRWWLVAVGSYAAAVLAIGKAVTLLGEPCIAKLLCAFSTTVACCFIALLIKRYVERSGCVPVQQPSTPRTLRIAEKLPPLYRATYYLLCSALTLSLFYTTGLSFLIAQLLDHLGYLPSQTSWIWTALYPLKTLMGMMQPPTNAQEVLSLGGGVYGDILPWAFPTVALEAYIVCRFLPKDLRPENAYSAGDSFLSIILFVLPLWLAYFVSINWGEPVYDYVFTNFRLTDTFSSTDSVVGFWVCLIAADFFYWVNHRASHIMSWLWVQHMQHHSCQSYNLLNGPREGNVITHFTPMFLSGMAPLSLFFPFPVANAVSQVVLVWNFWFHAVLPGPWPTVELLFNTPSLHRIHHAKNEDRLGKNYGSMLSIWDRMFGTFEPEFRNECDARDDICYGVIPNVQTWDANWMTVQPVYDIVFRQMKFNGVLAPLLHWTPPNSKCPKLGSRLNPREIYAQYSKSSAWLTYVAVETTIFSFMGFWIMFNPLQGDMMPESLGQGKVLPNAIVGALGMWSASCMARLLTRESESFWREEVLRKTLLLASLYGYLQATGRLNDSFWHSSLCAYVLESIVALKVLHDEIPQTTESGIKF